MNSELQILTMMSRPETPERFSAVTPLTQEPDEALWTNADVTYDVEAETFPLEEVLALASHYGEVIFGVLVDRSAEISDLNLYQGSALPTRERIPLDVVELEPAAADNYDVARHLESIHISLQTALEQMRSPMPQSVLLVILQPNFQ